MSNARIDFSRCLLIHAQGRVAVAMLSARSECIARHTLLSDAGARETRGGPDAKAQRARAEVRANQFGVLGRPRYREGPRLVSALPAPVSCPCTILVRVCAQNVGRGTALVLKPKH